jgi:xylulokinase
MTVVAGIDSSTQSCTIVLRDAETGVEVDRASAQHPPTAPPVSEQHPEAWWEALAKAASSLDLSDVAAVAVDGQGHGLVALDSADNPIRPAKLWNDTTSSAEAQELVLRIGAAEWARRTSIVPVAAFTITKLLWLARHEPTAFVSMRSILLPHDWLTWRLTGERVTDRSEASGTGWFSPASSEWDLELLDLVDDDVDWEPMLPLVAGPDDPIGRVRSTAARALGLRDDVVVSPGAHDNAATALALSLEAGDVVVSLGTSGTVFAPSDTPTHDPSGAVDGNADATGGFLPLSCLLNAAKVTDAFARLLGVTHAELAALALAGPARPDRAVLVAYLDGERTPNCPDARGVLAGLRSDVTREEVARAAFEGVVFGLYEGLRALEQLGVRTDGRLIVAGGAANSAAYRQFLADVFGRPVALASGDAATGVATQAAAVLHGSTTAEIAREWAAPLQVVAEPRDGQSIDEVHAAYTAASISALDAVASGSHPKEEHART